MRNFPFPQYIIFPSSDFFQSLEKIGRTEGMIVADAAAVQANDKPRSMQLQSENALTLCDDASIVACFRIRNAQNRVVALDLPELRQAMHFITAVILRPAQGMVISVNVAEQRLPALPIDAEKPRRTVIRRVEEAPVCDDRLVFPALVAICAMLPAARFAASPAARLSLGVIPWLPRAAVVAARQ